MKKLAFFSIAFALATPAFAGIVYVPLPGYQSVAGSPAEPRIFVSNPTAEPKTFRSLVLPTDTDGLDQDEASPATTVAPGQTQELTLNSFQRGLLQFESANDGPPRASSEMTWFGIISGGSRRIALIAEFVIPPGAWW